MAPLIFRVSIFLGVFASSFAYLLSSATTAVSATTIDITPQQVPGETIPVETKVGSGGSVEGAIGPKENEVQFPVLNLEKRLFSETDLQNRALPAKLIPQLKLPAPSKEVLKGELGHVTCGTAKIVKKVPREKKIINEAGEEVTIIDGYDDVPLEDSSVYIEASPVPFSTTQDYGQILAPTRFWQSIFVPKKGTDLNIGFSKSDPAPLPTRLADCGPEQEGAVLEQVLVTNKGPIAFKPLEGIVDAVKGFFESIFGGKSYATLNANTKQIKLLPGEAVLKDQTVGDNGFLNFFKPAKAKFSKEGNQESPVAYKSGIKDSQEKVTYAGVASLKGGTEDLIKSMYPAKLASRINLGDIVQLPPSSREYKGLTYTIPYRDTQVKVSPEAKEQAITKALSIWPTSRVRELWNRVESAALSAGINPAFMLAIWIEESGGSNGSTQSDFGCFPSGNTNQTIPFEKSMSCFIYFTTTEHPNDFTEWARYFCAPNVEPICSNNPNFLTNLKFWYDRLTQ